MHPSESKLVLRSSMLYLIATGRWRSARLAGAFGEGFGPAVSLVGQNDGSSSRWCRSWANRPSNPHPDIRHADLALHITEVFTRREDNLSQTTRFEATRPNRACGDGEPACRRDSARCASGGVSSRVTGC